MDPNKTVKLTEDQTKAITHLDQEKERYLRMGKRLREIGMPLLAQECERFSKSLKATIELQIKTIRHPEQFLFDKPVDVQK